MKTVRKLCAMLLMTMVLALPALADANSPAEDPGIIHTPGRMSNDVKLSLPSDLVFAVQKIVRMLGR